MGLTATISRTVEKTMASARRAPGLPTLRTPFDYPTGRRRKLRRNQGVGIPAPTWVGSDGRQPWQWGNEATRIGKNGFLKMRTNDAVAGAVNHFGDEIGKLKMFAYAPKAGIDPSSPEARLPINQSDRAKWFQKMYDHARGVASFQKQSPWSLIEDVLFWQIRYHYVENLGVAPDLRWGERRKVDAGGHLRLHPDHENVILERYQGGPAGEVEEMVFSLKDWVLLKPGSSANPEGDGFLALRMHRIATLYEEGDYNGAIFAKSMTIPTRILKWVSDLINATDTRSRQEGEADAIDWQEAMEMLVLNDKQTIVDIIKYPTNGAEYLLKRETRLESRATKALQNTALMADTRATGPTGSSKEARTTANSPTVTFTNFLGEAVTCYLNPALVETNTMMGFEPPPIKEGETEVRCQFVYPGELPSDTNPTKDSAADRVPEEKRPDPEGNSEKEKDSDEVE